MTFIGVVRKDADTDYGVSFPDFPGCIATGRTLEEAKANAEEALALHIAGMLEDGEPIPYPLDFDHVRAEATCSPTAFIATDIAARIPA